jgi:ubiquinone/menaquinone biosynthesis C-methylase UbiE
MNDGAEASLDETQQAAREQFSRRSGSYGAGHILADVADVREALECVDLPERSMVLDVATGGGHTGLHLAGLAHDVTLADISAEMLKRAEELAAQRGLEVATRQHPAENLPYSGESFDLVTCRVAAHHFSSPESFVRESTRVLKHGGWFVLIDGTVADDEPEAEAWAHTVEKLRDPSHARFLTPRNWVAISESNGLRVTRHWLWSKLQPDLNWYFQTADTPSDNRKQVIELIDNARESTREIFRIETRDGKSTWWWQMLTLVARKP